MTKKRFTKMRMIEIVNIANIVLNEFSKLKAKKRFWYTVIYEPDTIVFLTAIRSVSYWYALDIR